MILIKLRLSLRYLAEIEQRTQSIDKLPVSCQKSQDANNKNTALLVYSEQNTVNLAIDCKHSLISTISEIQSQTLKNPLQQVACLKGIKKSVGLHGDCNILLIQIMAGKIFGVLTRKIDSVDSRLSSSSLNDTFPMGRTNIV